LASKAAESYSAENGQTPNRFVHHHAGHFHPGVVASILATTAAVLGEYTHSAVAGTASSHTSGTRFGATDTEV
jgi:hypothetical protein